MRFKSIFALGIVMSTCSPQLQAGHLDVGLEYDTEWQTNFRGDYNWVNLLRLNSSFNITSSWTLDASTISIAKTSPESVIDDLQGYSNIEEDNLPLGIAVLGAGYRSRHWAIFLGIRNVNEDYFTSPVTSLFVNSSCGIFPTISGNYDIANYPLSSWCLHYRASVDNVTLQTSVYTGLGHRRIAGHDNVFRLSPGRDGLLSINSVEYDNNDCNYSLGCAVYYGVHLGDETLVETKTPQTPPETAPGTTKSLSVAPWINIEHKLADGWSVMAQASCSTSKANCRFYTGLGATCLIGNATLGAFADYAKYSVCSEIATELTCSVPLSEVLSVQPSVQLISTDRHAGTVGLIRLSLRL